MIIKQKTSKLLKSLLALTLLSVFAVMALVGCGGDEITETQSSAAESSGAVNESSEAVITESSAANESSESANVESSDEVSDESEEASLESSENDESSVPSDESSESDESSTPDEESSEPIIEPEIIGDGTKENPYLVFPDENMKLTTYEIGANETHFYGIYRIGGLDVTVNSEDLYIMCDGKKYTQKDGVVAFRVISAMASEAIVFEITNTSTSKQTYELCFENPVGTYANPVEIDIAKEYKISLLKDDEVGYYYKHIAEKDGVIVYKLVATSDGFLAVTNNRSYAQRTTDADGTVGDNGEKYVEIEVQKGDELIINVGALPKRGTRPAIEIAISCDYK